MKIQDKLNIWVKLTNVNPTKEQKSYTINMSGRLSDFDIKQMNDKIKEAIHDHAFLKCNDVRKINLSGCNLDIDIEDSGFKYMDMCCEEFICPENFAKKLHYFFA